MATELLNRRAALLVAHPGHELAVHGWLEQARPEVFVLTDGSGPNRPSRLHSTSNVLRAAGAKMGCIYGRCSEAEVYRAMLEEDTGLFVSLAEELAEKLGEERFDYVAGDMEESFNPVHDVWRIVINTAVALANRKREVELLNFDFSLFGRQDSHAQPGRPGVRIDLDGASFLRKLATAQSYPEIAPEVVAALYGKTSDPVLEDPDIKERIRSLLGDLGIDAFRVEYLRQVQVEDGANNVERPFYEMYGEKLVEAGRYSQVLRYRSHILPVADALRQMLQRSGCIGTTA